jgi:hypothetical protein
MRNDRLACTVESSGKQLRPPPCLQLPDCEDKQGAKAQFAHVSRRASKDDARVEPRGRSLANGIHHPHAPSASTRLYTAVEIAAFFARRRIA